MKNNVENYSEQVDTYADIMTLEDFNSCVHNGYFMPYDGVGYFVKDGYEDTERDVFEDYAQSATHVAWYNK